MTDKDKTPAGVCPCKMSSSGYVYRLHQPDCPNQDKTPTGERGRAGFEKWRDSRALRFDEREEMWMKAAFKAGAEAARRQERKRTLEECRDIANKALENNWTPGWVLCSLNNLLAALKGEANGREQE